MTEKNDKIDEGMQLISLQIPAPIYRKILAKGYSHREVYLLGVAAKDGNPQMLARVREIEQSNTILVQKIQTLAARLWKLETAKLPEDPRLNKKLRDFVEGEQ